MKILQWTEQGSLSEKVVKGVLDGFFLPYEIGLRAPLEWPDGAVLSPYRTPYGILAFRPGAWAHYGFKSETAFAMAVRKHAVRCKTAAGLLSLGPCRSVFSRARHWLVRGICSYEMEAVTGTDEEEAELKSFLKEHFPAAILREQPSGLVGLIRASRIFEFGRLYHAFVRLNKEQRNQFGLLLLPAILCFALSILTIFRLVFPVVTLIALVSLSLSVVTILKLSRRQLNK